MIQSCLSESQVQAYLNGVIDDGSASSIELHLGDCESCEQLAAELERHEDQDMLVRTLQLKGPELPEPSWVQRLALGPAEVSKVEAPVGASEELTTLGDYTLERVIGRGGMSVVFAATHRHLRRDVAVKVLARTTGNAISAERFAREMRAVAALDHPAIVRATDAGNWQQTWYLVMELVSGHDVGRLSRQLGPMRIADACEIVRQAARGLQHAHDLGIVHRDIKPSNLMVEGSGAVKILDFGLARAEDALDGEVSMQTSVGQLLGTLDYMAPEQANSSEVGNSADIYALGATLFKLLTGAPPHGRSTEGPVLDYLRRLATDDAPDIRAHRADVPVELASVIQQLLARRPEDRIASAAEVADALEPFVAGADLAAIFDEESMALADAATRGSDGEDAQRDATQVKSAVSDLFGASLSEASHKPSASHDLVSAAPPIKPPSRRRPWLVWLGSAGLLVLAGITLFVQTNVGQLKIEADENVEVSVRQVADGREVMSFETSQEAEKVRIRTGKYEVSLKSPSDQLVVSPRQVVVKRGESVLVRVQRSVNPAAKQTLGSVADLPADHVLPSAHKPKVSAQAKQPSRPTFDGESVEHWLRVVQYERSPALRQVAANNALMLADAVERARVHEVVLAVLPALLDGVNVQGLEETVGVAMVDHLHLGFSAPVDRALKRAEQAVLAERLSEMLAGEAASEHRAALWTVTRLRASIREEAGWESVLSKLNWMLGTANASEKQRQKMGAMRNAAFTAWAACSPEAEVADLVLKNATMPQARTLRCWQLIAKERGWELPLQQRAQWLVWSLSTHVHQSYAELSPDTRGLVERATAPQLSNELRDALYSVVLEELSLQESQGVFHSEQNQRIWLLCRLVRIAAPSASQNAAVVAILERLLIEMLEGRDRVREVQAAGVATVGDSLVLLTGQAPQSILQHFSAAPAVAGIKVSSLSTASNVITSVDKLPAVAGIKVSSLSGNQTPEQWLLREQFPMHYIQRSLRSHARDLPLMVLPMLASLGTSEEQSDVWLSDLVRENPVSTRSLSNGTAWRDKALLRFVAEHPPYREMLVRWMRGGGEQTQLPLEMLYEVLPREAMVELLLGELDNEKATNRHLRIVLRLLHHQSPTRFGNAWSQPVGRAIARVEVVIPEFSQPQRLELDEVDDFIYYLSIIRPEDTKASVTLVEKYLLSISDERAHSGDLIELDILGGYQFLCSQTAATVLSKHPDVAHRFLERHSSRFRFPGLLEPLRAAAAKGSPMPDDKDLPPMESPQ